MFDFRRITLFCLEKRLSKHKVTVCSGNLGGAMVPLPPSWLCQWYTWGRQTCFLPWAPSNLGTILLVWIDRYLSMEAWKDAEISSMVWESRNLGTCGGTLISQELGGWISATLVLKHILLVPPKNEIPNLHGNYIKAIIKTIFIMSARGSRKGYGNPKRISFLSGFSFLLRLVLVETCGPWHLNVMAICSRQE